MQNISLSHTSLHTSVIVCVLQVMIQILKDMGITEYEPRVINQMLEFTYSKSPTQLHMCAEA